MTAADQDRAAFLAAICADPADDLPRLVFADWLDEHGEPERAEFIRVQVALAKYTVTPECWTENMPFGTMCTDPKCPWTVWADLRERELELFPVMHADMRRLGTAGGRDRDGLIRRGFYEDFRCSAADWLALADELYWRPGLTDPCPACRGESRHWQRHTYCPGCGKVTRGVIPRPCPPTAQPITAVTITGWGGNLDELELSGVTPEGNYTSSRWPGIAFTLPDPPA